MTTQTLLEKAIAGGYAPVLVTHGHYSASDWIEITLENGLIHQVLLDPLAWAAVGKVEGWEEECDRCGKQSANLRKEEGEYGGSVCDRPDGEHRMSPYWRYYMHRMIDALAKGETIEEYLATL